MAGKTVKGTMRMSGTVNNKVVTVTGLTTFLASTASNHMTGQTVMIDGGMVLFQEK